MQIGPESYAIPTFPRSVISSGERKMSGCLNAASGQIMAWEVVSNAPGAAHLSSSASRWNRPQRVVAYPVRENEMKQFLFGLLCKQEWGKLRALSPMLTCTDRTKGVNEGKVV